MISIPARRRARGIWDVRPLVLGVPLALLLAVGAGGPGPADAVGSAGLVAGRPASFQAQTEAAPSRAPRWEVDRDASALVAVLHKAGLLRFLGHEHGILARDWSAEVFYDEDDLASSRIVVTVPAEALEIDSAEARAAADVDPDGPEGEDLEEIRQKMVGPEQLDAGSHPEIRFESERIEADGDDGLRIHGTLRVRGQRRALEVEATREARDGGVRVRGSFEIRHRDFGIEPVSIGGVVKVADEIDILFDVLARPAPTDRR